MTFLIKLAVLAASLLVLAACGGGDTVSREEFEQEVGEAQEDVQAELEELRGSDSAAELEERAADAADAIRERADELADVEAPEEVQDEQEQLVARYRELADQLEQDLEGLDEEDVDGALEQLEQLESEDLERLLDELRDSG